MICCYVVVELTKSSGSVFHSSLVSLEDLEEHTDIKWADITCPN